MKEYVARAMQVSYLEKEQLEKVQAREDIRHYIIPNLNIQEVFGIPTIREKYNLPIEDELLSRHYLRIESELKKKGFLKTPNNEALDYVEWIHVIDWNVFYRGSEIIWDFTHGPGKSSKGILARLKKSDKESEETAIASTSSSSVIPYHQVRSSE